jgi:hypothetical protein
MTSSRSTPHYSSNVHRGCAPRGPTDAALAPPRMHRTTVLAAPRCAPRRAASPALTALLTQLRLARGSVEDSRGSPHAAAGAGRISCKVCCTAARGKPLHVCQPCASVLRSRAITAMHSIHSLLAPFPFIHSPVSSYAYI